MHELAITESIVGAVTERVGDAKVIRVQLIIGKLSGVVPEAVRFCFEVCADGSPLAGARLDIIETPGRAECRDCQADVQLDSLIALCACGSANLHLLSGQELRLTEVELA
ncbi:MAG: hydrogenase maturation nickel metallochaperone HypA [Candidatus Binatia bacterium]